MFFTVSSPFRVWFLLGQPNFGVVEIDWDATPVSLKMEVRDANGVAVVGVNISLSSLRPGNSEYLSNSNTGKYHRHCLLEVSLGWIVRHRLAILFYSTLTCKFRNMQLCSEILC